uniref:ATP synthase delta chain, chloroplastic n=1 Tax=Araucaria cunninghamii TaxID=56994 RepID=A0A0D6R8U2_ARACU
METLSRSVSALSLHSTPLKRRLQSHETVQQLPVAPAQVAGGSRSSSPFAHAHCSISKAGPGKAVRSSSSRDGVRVTQARAIGHRKRPVTVMRDSAAGGYAAALLEIGQANNMLEVINRDMEKLSHLLKNQEVYDFLINPIVENDKKKSILKAIADDAKFHTHILSFLNLLVDKKRMDIVKNIVKEFGSIYNELTDTQVATVSSALKLENHQLSQIAKRIQSLTGAKNVKLLNVIDPALVAGFVVRFGKNASRMIDMSLKDQFEKLSIQFDSASNEAAF